MYVYNRKWSSYILILSALLLFTACNRSVMWVGNRGTDYIKASYSGFTGTKRHSVKLKENQTLVVAYESVVEKGSLDIEIKDQKGELVAVIESDQTGEITLKPEKDEKYLIYIMGNHTKGKFDLKWKIEER